MVFMRLALVLIVFLWTVSIAVLAGQRLQMAKVVSVKEYLQGHIVQWEGRVPAAASTSFP